VIFVALTVNFRCIMRLLTVNLACCEGSEMPITKKDLPIETNGAYGFALTGRRDCPSFLQLDREIHFPNLTIPCSLDDRGSTTSNCISENLS